MSPLDLISQHWSIITTAVGGVVGFVLLYREVKQLSVDQAKHEVADSRQHEETARRVDRIEEANMSNAQSNAVLAEQISNLKERLMSLENTFKDEMRLFRDSLQGLFREKK